MEREAGGSLQAGVPFPSSLKGAGLKGGRWEPSSRAAWASENRAVPRSRGGLHAAQNAPQRDGITRGATLVYLLPRQCRPRSRGFLEAILRRLIFLPSPSSSLFYFPSHFGEGDGFVFSFTLYILCSYSINSCVFLHLLFNLSIFHIVQIFSLNDHNINGHSNDKDKFYFFF